MINVWENNYIFRGLIFVITGLLMLAILLFQHWRYRSLRLKAVGIATATINNIRREGNNGFVYQPVYEYYAEGEMRKVVSRRAFDTMVAESGSQVDLFYIPGEPEKIYVPKEQRTNTILIVFVSFISIMFVFLGTAGCAAVNIKIGLIQE